MSARWALAAALAVAAPALAGSERIAGARLTVRAAADPAPVVAGLGAAAPEWVAWTAPGLPAGADLCCFGGDWRVRRCSLAGREQGWGTRDDGERPAAPAELLVLVEVERGRAIALRAAGPSCPVDGAGRAVTWIEGVRPEAGLALLEAIARDRAPRRGDEPAEMALATLAHLEGGVDRLIRLLRETPDRELRRQSLFWLGQSEDPRALAELTRLLEN